MPIPSASDFVISRTFDAPRDRVFAAFSKAEQLEQWWGPTGLMWISCSLQFRPGGRFHYCMKSQDGQEMWGKFDYLEIEAPERIVFTNSFSNAHGDTTRAPFAANFPKQVLNVVRFAERAGRTTLSLQGCPYKASEIEQAFFQTMRPSMQQSFAGTLDQLAAYLSKAL